MKPCSGTLDKKDGKGIENQRKVLVAQAFIDVKQQFESRSAALEAQHFIDIERARVYDPGVAAGRNWILNDEERKRWDNEADQYITQFEDTMRAKVQAKLDSGEYQRQVSTVNTCLPQNLGKRCVWKTWTRS